jgi:Chitobiase/beta-hexosaminidase C-terminal domain/Alpha galactosidase C-terminal beta sandwich domain
MSPKIKNIISALLLIVGSNLCAQNPANPFKAPLYWNVYENNYLQSKANVANNYISEADLLANINWLDANLKQYGYTMVCIDGWGDVDYDQYGYRTKHSSMWIHDYAWWSTFLQSKGMTLGIYDNPLWINKNAANAGVKVKGTNILLSSLINSSETSTWFTWVQVDRTGAQEYVKGCVQHYADMGVKFFRVDFLSWYESGWDRNMGTVGPVRTLANYQTALQWMREACDANGMFLSLVMPNLTNDGVSEQKYGHMVRIDEDCTDGGWTRFSENVRGVKRSGWSQYANPFDGYSYWSKIAGKGKMILDGDFIRLNTYSNDEERKTVVSLHLLAGGPLSVADQYNTIGASLWIYQNEEMLALNADKFVGKPLSGDPTNALSQVWKGQLSNGDWIVGFFNRETSAQNRSINFSTDLGLSGNVFVRDLWNHSDIGSVSSLSKSVASHACQIYRISSNTNKVLSPVFSIIGGTYSGSFSVSLSTTTSGASIYYTVDGTVPTSASLVYTNPVVITATATLKAIAIKSGLADSYVSKEIYTINTPAAQTAMFIAGTFNSWSLTTLAMNYIGANNWTTNPIPLTAGAQQLKFANTSNWTGSDWGNTSGLIGTATLSTGGLPNLSFTIPITASYIISFNDASLNYSIKSSLTTNLEVKSPDIQVLVIKSSNQILVDINNNENAEIEVISMSGQILYRMSSGLKKNLIQLKPDTRNSLLLVRVKTESSTSIVKVVL